MAAEGERKMKLDGELEARQLEEAVVAAYKEGRKIREICDDFGVEPNAIYYMLDRHGVVADRVKRRKRLLDAQSVDSLLKLIDHQNARIEEEVEARRRLEAALAERDPRAAETVIELVNVAAELRRRLQWWRTQHPRTKEPDDL